MIINKVNVKKKDNIKLISSNCVLSFFLFFLINSCSVIKKKEIISSSVEIKFKKSLFFYEINMDTLLSDKKILRLEILPNVNFIKGQETISYDFCDLMENCDTIYQKIKNGKKVIFHEEITGRIVNDSSYWIHPPRSGYFKILELNAFPYYKKNVKKNWTYKVVFGQEWGDKRWVEWEGLKTSLSYYTLSKTPVYYRMNELNLKCFKINANTEIEGIGKTKSIFYFNEVYGFVYMYFETINNKRIEFKMI